MVEQPAAPSSLTAYAHGVARGVGDVTGAHGAETAGREAGVALAGGVAAAALEVAGKAVAARLGAKGLLA